ncbi:hypothetical protein BGZ76_006388, partial [Entomortierella beljakovae]
MLRVESFSNSEATYDIQVDFSISAFGNQTDCTCPYFHSYRSSCKHMALVAILIPEMELKTMGMEFKANKVDDTQAILDQAQREYLEYMELGSETTFDKVGYCIQRLSELDSLRDNNAVFPNEDTINYHLQQALNHFEISFPPLREHKLH